VSPRRHVTSMVGILTALALVFGVFAGTASAKKMTRHQKAAVRHQLLRSIKKNPRLVKKASFLKKASLVDFKLPITVRLRTSEAGQPAATSNTNVANIDLGASLGQRQLSLGGTLPGYIQFHDSFDGGALGNVDIVLQPGGDITTTSLPLLWNTQVATDTSTHWYDAGFGAAGGNPGCSDFKNSNAIPDSGFLGAPLADTTQGKTLLINAGSIPNPGTQPIPGVPFFTSLAGAASHALAGTVEELPGADDISLLTPSADPSDINAMGPNPDPFPQGSPYAPVGAENVQDSVLRTANIHLSTLASGTQVQEDSTVADGAGPQSSQNLVVGQSGGQANLFGNIPGKGYGIDVTVSLGGAINSILRSVDPDVDPLLQGVPYNQSAFDCRQAFTGSVFNAIPGLHLIGNLHISPAITTDGKLRIAKATLSSLNPSHVALAACLMPYSTFSASTGAAVPVPGDALSGTQSATNINAVPTAACNASPQGNVAASAFPNTVGPLAPVVSTNSDGSQVSVSGDITTQISADVLIGQ
jgi:hypothetical protein